MAKIAGTLYQRFSAARVRTALADTPVVLVNGPRQCGKTTLVRQLVGGERGYLTLDDDTVLDAARNDPAGFVRSLDRVVIDEVQRAPNLLRAIKTSVDNDRRPGRFLLTGSSNLLTLSQVPESIAGRMEVFTLLPLAHAEIRGKKSPFIERAFSGHLAKPSEVVVGHDLIHLVLSGGYPEMLGRADPNRRRAWARAYINSILQRDVRDIAEVEKLDQTPRLLRAIALHSTQLTNFTQIGGRMGLDDKTTRKYLGIMEQLYLLRRVEPWFRNRIKRLIKTPKVNFLDSGLLAALLATTAERVAKDRSLFGVLLETFVFGEILRLSSWADQAYAIYYYRDKDQNEVDIVIENELGEIIGIEVKASATVSATDFKGLRKLAELCGAELKLGVVLYDGENLVPFGERMFAAPVSSLWC
ncbi:MAG: ATP-binding protein [Deltaproteobacteria bacterium]|nr:ATP-binding protein [Deltaproteobacteria bacterium]